MPKRQHTPTFELKRGDLRPTITHTIRDSDGEVVDLTNATGVRFYLQNPDEDAPRVSAPMTILNEAQGEVQYEWVEGDTAGAGRHYAEFVVEWPDGAGGVEPQTDPADGYYFFDIDEPIGRGDPAAFDGALDVTVGHITADSGDFGSLTVSNAPVNATDVARLTDLGDSGASEHDHAGDILIPAEVNIGDQTPDPATYPLALFSVAGVTWWVGTEVTADMAETDVFIDVS